MSFKKRGALFRRYRSRCSGRPSIVKRNKFLGNVRRCIKMKDSTDLGKLIDVEDRRIALLFAKILDRLSDILVHRPKDLAAAFLDESVVFLFLEVEFARETFTF